jgi:hypothetical protein
VPFLPNDELTSPMNLISWEMIDRDGTIEINAFRADLIQRGYDRLSLGWCNTAVTKKCQDFSVIWINGI